MYDKIAAIMNRDYGASDMDASLVEDYLRHGRTDLISGDEMIQIDVIYERLL
jgi:hypothetical protein